MQKNELPCERFVSHGPESLTDAELLAVMLRTGTAKQTALDVARRILAEWTSLSALYNLTLADLRKIPGIGEVKAIQLLCIAELSKRLSRENARERLSFRSPQSVAGYYMEQLRHERCERVLLLLLDNKLCLLEEKLLSLGTSDAALIAPREIFRLALRENASRVMLLHNHPSGDPTPSRADILATRKVASSGECLGIELADHLVIGDGCFVSMREEGLL